jgi:hypothetical protein
LIKKKIKKIKNKNRRFRKRLRNIRTTGKFLSLWKLNKKFQTEENIKNIIKMVPLSFRLSIP